MWWWFGDFGHGGGDGRLWIGVEGSGGMYVYVITNREDGMHGE